LKKEFPALGWELIVGRKYENNSSIGETTLILKI